jgi:GT2 family glycosyltransferase
MPSDNQKEPVLDLSVIIVNHNTRDMTIECIASVFKETPSVAVEVVLVDNASTDGSVDAVRARFPQIICKVNDRNVIFPIANNEAVPLTSGRHILLLNSDTVVLDRALEKMVAFLDANPQVGVCGAKMYDAKLQPWHYETWTLTASRYLIHPLMLRWFGDIGDKRVDWVCGACLMIRREVVEQIGLMDDYMYGEDMDWCLRAKKKGWEIWHRGDARIIHYWGVTGTTPEKIAWRIFAGRRSKVYYIAKHGRPACAIGIRLALLIEAFVKMALYSLQAPLLPDASRAYRRGQRAGYWKLTKAILTGRVLDPLTPRV